MSTAETRDSAALAASLQKILTGSWRTQVLYVAAELRIPDLLSAGPQGSIQLALAANAHAPSLHRLLRGMCSIGLCAENADGTFTLTPLGELLREDDPRSLRAWTIWWGHHLWPVWGHLLHSIRTGESARKLLSGTEGFRHLERDPASAATFYRMTVELTRLAVRQVLDAYDFSGLRHIVDVGGGHGELLAHILRANPGATGILFDLQAAVDGAAERFQRNHPDLAGRCVVVAGDFFVSVPAGADAYLLKSVLHDWDDDRSIEILRSCRRAMGPDARLLILEPVLPGGARTTVLDDGLSRQDLTMLVAHGSRERTETEFGVLLESASLRASRCIAAGPDLGILEAFPRQTS